MSAVNTLGRVQKHIECEYVYEQEGPSGTLIQCSDVGEITFEKLAALAEEFGTNLIDMGCDTGTGSDPCHYRQLFIRQRTR